MKLKQGVAIVLSVMGLLATSCGGDEGGSTITSTAPETTTSTTTSQATSSTAPISWLPEPSTEEFSFESGGFRLVGDLSLPGGEGPYPAVIMVSGSGSQTRSSTPTSSLVLRTFRDAGFAVLSWDKPGSGESTGEFEEGQGLRQRAEILAQGIRVLGQHPAIDATKVGLWGLSQAGWVMPLAMELTDDISFMISVSGGGEDSIEQGAYQISEQLVCRGVPRDQAELAEKWGPQAAKGESYVLYVEAMEILLPIPGMDQFIGSEMASEGDWQPWPPEIDAYFDPVTVLERTTIPVLAVFGEMDKNIDPIQGAAAYERALTAAGNPDFHVELIPGIGHTMQKQMTGCIGEPGSGVSERYTELMEEWAAKLAAMLAA